MTTQPTSTNTLVIGPERWDCRFMVAADIEQAPALLAILKKMLAAEQKRKIER